MERPLEKPPTLDASKSIDNLESPGDAGTTESGVGFSYHDDSFTLLL